MPAAAVASPLACPQGDFADPYSEEALAALMAAGAAAFKAGGRAVQNSPVKGGSEGPPARKLTAAERHALLHATEG